MVREFGTRAKNAQKRRSADCTICDEAGGCGFRSRFFRGVCPISNRAKEYCVQRVVVRRRAPAQRVRCVENLRSTANLCVQEAETGPEFASARAGFLMGREETPGPVFGFGYPPNKNF